MELKHVARLVLTQFYFRDQPLGGFCQIDAEFKFCPDGGRINPRDFGRIKANSFN